MNPKMSGRCRSCMKDGIVDDDGRVRKHWTQDVAARAKAAARNQRPPDCRGSDRPPVEGTLVIPTIRFGEPGDQPVEWSRR